MYERGQREPDFETLEAIADFFNVDMNTLLCKSPSPAPAHNSEYDQLITAYEQLNDAGKEAALSYLSYLGQQPIYKNDHQSGMGKNRSGSVT